MNYELGKNYIFLKANSDSVVRIRSEKNPFYPFPIQKIPDNPSVTNEPLLIPRFLYDVGIVRNQFNTKPIDIIPYIRFMDKTLHCDFKLGENLYLVDNQFRKIRISKFPTRVNETLPLHILIDHSKQIHIGSAIQSKELVLYPSKREKYKSAKYLSLRDIVNPYLKEGEVIEKIESLYFDKESKTFLFRLVKILYSGSPEEEYKIITNLFRYEKQFAEFLNKRMFTIEILPMVYGPFLQSILKDIDERYIKYSLNQLSKPVFETVKNSVSKNKFKYILDSPVAKPNDGEDLISIIESQMYKQFARNIYYEDGSIFTYREEGEPENAETIQLIPSEVFNFSYDKNHLDFFAITKTKIFVKTKSWIETLRFDCILSKKDFETFEFKRLPPNLLLEIPYYPTATCLVGAGMTKERECFEFSLLWSSY
ncbi:flagellar motor switch protein FliG [Leptospira sp. 96542]|nr:flagellar motor switch protein FliG [Leptospira sp. 96542]